MEKLHIVAHEELVEAVDLYNKTLADDEATRGQLKDALDAVETKLSAAQAAYKADAYFELLETSDPFLQAIIQFEYPTVRVTVEKNKETGEEVGRSVVETTNEFQLTVLEAIFKKTQADKTKTLAHDAGWYHAVECLNKVMCLRIAKKILGVRQPDGTVKETTALVNEVAERYKMSAAAAKVELAKVPTTDAQVGELVQAVADKIWFKASAKDETKNEIAFSKQDINFLIEGYTTANRRGLALKTANHAGLLQLIFKMMHAVAVQANYELIYKAKKS